MSTSIYSIKVSGRFQLIAPDNTEIILPSAKTQAILALLAIEDRMTRQRNWLQDKLWSDREPEKGSNSLRQSLYQTRRAFGDDAEVLIATRNLVTLDSRRIRVINDTEGEFLEGLDVGDQEFEEWLLQTRMQRNGRATPSVKSPLRGALHVNRHIRAVRRGLVVECTNESHSLLGQQELRFSDLIQKSVREVLDFEPVEPGSANDSAQDVIALGIQAFPAGGGGQTGIRVAVYEGVPGTSNWSGSATGVYPDFAEPLGPNFLNLCHRASAALTDLLCRPSSHIAHEEDPNFFAGSGMRQMYSMLPGSIEEAGKLFDKAYEIRPRGLYLALRAQLAVIDYVESEGGNREELREFSDELCAKAMAEEGTNSVVLSAVAHARLVFDDDFSTAAELSRLSVLSNPANPLAWSAWANILLNTGKVEDAARAAHTAKRLSNDTFYRYWTEFQFATTAVALKQSSSAILHAERARALNPRYRPALRYLVGLHSNAGDFEKARAAVGRLQRVEPDTTPDRFVNDSSYPVSMMRLAGLVDADRFDEI